MQNSILAILLGLRPIEELVDHFDRRCGSSNAWVVGLRVDTCKHEKHSAISGLTYGKVNRMRVKADWLTDGQVSHSCKVCKLKFNSPFIVIVIIEGSLHVLQCCGVINL
jgi:hypothetical protein